MYHVNFESQISWSFRKAMNNIKAYFNNAGESEELEH